MVVQPVRGGSRRLYPLVAALAAALLLAAAPARADTPLTVRAVPLVGAITSPVGTAQVLGLTRVTSPTTVCIPNEPCRVTVDAAALVTAPTATCLVLGSQTFDVTTTATTLLGRFPAAVFTLGEPCRGFASLFVGVQVNLDAT